MRHARLYGLDVSSELVLHEARAPEGAADVRILRGAPATALDGDPPGRRLLNVSADQQYFTATEDGQRYLLRFHGTCEFEIDRDLTTITSHALPGVAEDRVAVLAVGTTLAFLLIMRGYPVLHASAVQLGDHALAFVGRSGMGKSTMATLMCADGARLITDDLLRLHLQHSPPTCSLGATELRLRKAAAELSESFAEAPDARLTGDERAALRMRSATQDGLPLRAIVIPVPDHVDQGREPEVVRLPGKQALLYLLQFPRIAGWEDAEVLDRQLGELARVVDAVPVFVARMPWGPPFPPGLAARVRDAVGLAQVPLADSTAAR